MTSTAHRLVLALGPILGMAASASADTKEANRTPKKAPVSATAWAVGDLVEVSYRLRTTVEERSRALGDEGEGIAASSARDLVLVYIDRSDRVRDKRVVVVTRHFKKVKLKRNGLPVEVRGLARRNVTLTRRGVGTLEARWEGGRRFGKGKKALALLPLVEAGPWPDVDVSWKLGLGSRRGVLRAVTAETHKWPGKVPAYVKQAVEDCDLQQIPRGSWSLTIDGSFAREGRLRGSVTLSGRETASNDLGTVVIAITHTRKISLTRSLPKLTRLPPGAASRRVPRKKRSRPDPERSPEPDPGDPNPPR